MTLQASGLAPTLAPAPDHGAGAEPQAATARKTISLAMIVRNEADRLRGAVASARGLVDEVVIVDTGSEDGTQDVARELATTYAEFPWCDDFAAARNAALDLCTSDWVLVLDSASRGFRRPGR
jgi:glycosyltransferase involved in cell wall biosynthesis